MPRRWEQDRSTTRRNGASSSAAGVTFHDGTPFNADAVIWNLDRFFKNDSPQFEAAGSAISAAASRSSAAIARSTIHGGDETTRPVSYWPYLAVYILYASPQSFEANGRDWAKVAAAGAAGTGPFRITRFVPRQLVELSRNDSYWNAEARAKLDKIVLIPTPEANTRLAALRGNQVDWIEVPPPDAIPSLRSAGFQITTGSYPHVWPWVFAAGKQGDPVQDVRVRQALNYCFDRAELVALLADTAEPSVGFFKPNDPNFGTPQNRYRLDAATRQGAAGRGRLHRAASR